MSGMGPSSNGSTPNNGSGPPPGRTRSGTPHRSAIRGRIVVTTNSHGAETGLTPDPSGVEPPTVPARNVPRPSPEPPAPRPTVRRAPTRPSPAVAVAPPAAVGSDSAAAATKHGSDRSEWCSIVFAPLPHGGEFQVVAVQEGGRREVVARSQPFRMPGWCRLLPLRRLPNLGAPRRAHDELVERFVASGWQQMQTRGRWHDTALIRARPKP
jgi:hypothetical protein